MKVKTDFVTNSSSSCFVVAIDPDEIEGFEEYITDLDRHPDARNEGVACYFASTDIQALLDYTNGRPYDWASKPRGICYYNMSKGEFKMCKGAIEGGQAAAHIRVDWNVCDTFRRDWEDHLLQENAC